MSKRQILFALLVISLILLLAPIIINSARALLARGV